VGVGEDVATACASQGRRTMGLAALRRLCCVTEKEKVVTTDRERRIRIGLGLGD